ncbi:hypothetical protein GKZ89_13615 [Bacillus mangrovi]|uniref:Uncharacterized protein n=1 Tax=Metabacillus mangrovi TaxID=1491830 RepID=A0A7X2V5Q6_9BACI|nr:hypothetical protein [Metabacillus mangrovi]MTH54436.1 hypothetical protein [Metabacillus mangrovi]
MQKSERRGRFGLRSRYFVKRGRISGCEREIGASETETGCVNVYLMKIAALETGKQLDRSQEPLFVQKSERRGRFGLSGRYFLKRCRILGCEREIGASETETGCVNVYLMKIAALETGKQLTRSQEPLFVPTSERRGCFGLSGRYFVKKGRISGCEWEIGASETEAGFVSDY